MSGTKAGAAKAAQTNKDKYGDDFYAKIGAKSWDNPERSHVTGFAKLPKDVVVELGRKGGQQNKGKKYAKQPKELKVKVELTTAEEIRALYEEDQTSDSTNISE